MQIEVRDGSKTRWVEEFACFLPNGDLAFSYYETPDIIPPDWYGAPESSLLREEHKLNNPEHPDEELRSMHAGAAEILTFYKERSVSGGLWLTENPVVDHALQMTNLSRLEPGFYAENDDYQLSLDIYEHRGVVFWRVKHGPKLPSGFRSKKEPKYLVFISESDGKVMLRNPETGDELWAPSEALINEQPRHAQYPRFAPPKKLRVSWSLVPDWLKLPVAPEIDVTASPSFSGGTLVGFSTMKLKQDSKIELESFLDRLDASGFDPCGIQTPDHSYYLRPMTGGRHITVHVSERSGDKAILTFVSTVPEPVLYAYYQTPRTMEVFLYGS